MTLNHPVDSLAVNFQKQQIEDIVVAREALAEDQLLGAVRESFNQVDNTIGRAKILDLLTCSGT